MPIDCEIANTFDTFQMEMKMDVDALTNNLTVRSIYVCTYISIHLSVYLRIRNAQANLHDGQSSRFRSTAGCKVNQ